MKKNNGSNSHGFSNEEKIVNSLNKNFDFINNNLKEFVKYICTNKKIDYSKIKKIKAERVNNNKLKEDIYLNIDDNKIGISLKIGNGNSIHQEKCESFISMITDKLNANQRICDSFRLLIWADGTLDGTASLIKDEKGVIISRYNLSEFKKRFYDDFKNIKDFLKTNERELIEYFLFLGKNKSQVDFVYHGNELYGNWISKEEIIRYNLENKRNNINKLNVGNMSIQSWNVSLKGTSENKRGQIQVKYSSLKKDLEYLKKIQKRTFSHILGVLEEVDFTRILNKDKKHIFWKKILKDKVSYENYFVINVSTKVFSILSNKKVFPKSDAYIIETQQINEEYLEKNGYTLNEKNLNDFKYKTVENSGISIKKIDSKKYTIQKFTLNSFCNIFREKLENPLEIFFSLLVYSSDEDFLTKNNTIALNLKLDLDEFLNKLRTIYGSDYNKQQLFDLVRTDSKKLVSEIIKNDEEIKNKIFSGKGIFESPYFASYLYKNNNIFESLYEEFDITTGSGRTKNKYTIILKPSLRN